MKMANMGYRGLAHDEYVSMAYTKTRLRSIEIERAIRLFKRAQNFSRASTDHARELPLANQLV